MTGIWERRMYDLWTSLRFQSSWVPVNNTRFLIVVGSCLIVDLGDTNFEGNM